MMSCDLDQRLAIVDVSLDRLDNKNDTLDIKSKKQLEEEGDENAERGNWSGKLDFLLACLGYAVGLGNVWRFPYLCYKNGGGAFFIPYCTMLLLVGIPIFFMELSLGQFTSSGPLTCWKFAPIFSGIGAGMVIVSAMVGIYYNMIIAWAFFYLFASFTTDLPWQYCGDWSGPYCAAKLKAVDNASHCTTLDSGFRTYNGTCFNESTPIGIYNRTEAALSGIKPILPAEEYLYGRVLGRHESAGLHDMGGIRWDLALCLLLSWIVVFLALVNGIKSSGKVVYFTALFPYLVLIIFFIRAIMLEGFYDGVAFYLTPDLSKLADAQVWKDAAVQIFFSLSASWGGLITLASYNRFHTDTLRDSLIVCFGNCLTSFFAGFSVFGFLGYLAIKMETSIDNVATSGVGLAFVIYPEAIMRIPGSTVWAILFFVMLITLGLDSEFALVETVSTSIIDLYPDKLRKRSGFVLLAICIIMFFIGLALCTNGGVWLLQLMDDYAGGWNVLVLAVLECLAIGWFYGFPKFRIDIGTMLGKRACCCLPWMACSFWWGLCWCFFTPLLCTAVIIFSLVKYKHPTFDHYDYPPWAEGIGWIFTLIVLAGVIVTPAIRIFRGERNLITPNREWGPALVKHRQLIWHLQNFVVDPWCPDNQPEREMSAAYDHNGVKNLGYDDEERTRF